MSEHTSFALYEAYGTRPYEWGDDPDRQKANTKEEEKDLGLLNEGMRFRDLETGVFLTRDPIGYGDGPNVYCYVHCNPITHFDALGLEEDEITSDDSLTAAVTQDGTLSAIDSMTTPEPVPSFVPEVSTPEYGPTIEGAEALSASASGAEKENEEIIFDVYSTGEAFGVPGLHHLYTISPEGMTWGRNGSSGVHRGGGSPGDRDSIPPEHYKVGEMAFPGTLSENDVFQYLGENGTEGAYFPNLNNNDMKIGDCHNSLFNAVEGLGGEWVPNSAYEGRVSPTPSLDYDEDPVPATMNIIRNASPFMW